jgi:hypothetical protein
MIIPIAKRRSIIVEIITVYNKNFSFIELHIRHYKSCFIGCWLTRKIWVTSTDLKVIIL